MRPLPGTPPTAPAGVSSSPPAGVPRDAPPDAPAPAGVPRDAPAGAPAPAGASAGVPAPARYADWVRLALAEARAVAGSGDVPIGAVVVDEGGAVIGRGHNVREALADPTGHAEVVALREAGAARHTWRLAGCTLVVTLEPCAMCAGAAILSRVDRIVFGAWDDKAGACGSVWDLPRDRRALHRAEVVGGVLEQECADLLLGFFEQRR